MADLSFSRVERVKATEFSRLFRSYLGGKATQENGVWIADDVNSSYLVERVSEQTVVVFLGNESFGTTVTAGSANSTVSVDP